MVSLPGFSLAAGHGRGRRALDHRKHGGWVAVAWLYLFVAGAMEIAWSTAMKYSEGFTRFWPSVATIVLSLTSFVLLSQAMKTLPLGTAYGVWTGIGALGSALVGIVFLGEPREPLRLLCIVLIFAGIVGLKLTSRS